jgi:hypothetical protein
MRHCRTEYGRITLIGRSHVSRTTRLSRYCGFPLGGLCAAFGLADRTIDREPGERVGRRELVVGHTGDQKFWSYAEVVGAIGVGLAVLAMVRPIWEPSAKKKAVPADTAQRP